MIDTIFLSYVLGFFLLAILFLYLYQITRINSKPNCNKLDKFLPIILNTCKTPQNMGMPVHRVGPIINFHQSFNKYNKLKGYGGPTGIPELGWRNYYLENFNKNEVKKEDPFDGISTRNYLNNMENVKNIYRNYQ
jgi:hypothetical protein